MASVNLVVIVQSVQALMSPSTDNSLQLAAILAVAAALGDYNPFLTPFETDPSF